MLLEQSSVHILMGQYSEVVVKDLQSLLKRCGLPSRDDALCEQLNEPCETELVHRVEDREIHNAEENIGASDLSTAYIRNLKYNSDCNESNAMTGYNAPQQGDTRVELHRFSLPSPRRLAAFS